MRKTTKAVPQTVAKETRVARDARMLGDDPEAFAVTYTPSHNGIFNVYLFGAIEDATQFIEAIEAMQQASEGDVVIINLSTNGGNLDATDTFLQAMSECRARVIVRASGGVHSAGTVILLAADEFTLSENFNCLIHNGSTGAVGKFSDMKAEAAFTMAYMENFARTTYDGFLTPDEIDDLIAGKDFWLGPEEFIERWKMRAALQDVEISVDEPATAA